MARPKKQKDQAAMATLPPELIKQLQEQIKNEVLQGLKDESKLKEEMAQKARDEATAIRKKFVDEMKASPEPWVDIIMWTETPTGVKYELDWNDAFITHLEANGIKGTDQDQTVQKWVSMLLYSTAGSIDEKLTPNDESKFE